MVVRCLHPSSDVYSHPEEEEHGAESHEDGGDQRDEDLLDELARELGRCDLVDEEPAEDTDLDSLRAFTLSAICFSDYDFIHHRVEQAVEGKFELGARKKVHIYHISITKLS